MSTEGPGQLFLNTYYVAQILCAILYGVELMLYFQIMSRLVKRVKDKKFLMFFSTTLHVCITIVLATICFLGQQMWVIYQDFPGGPLAYFRKYVSAWPRTLGGVACVILELMSNGVSIHRCWTVWSGNWKVILVPSLLWFASLAIAIILLCVIASPSYDFFSGFGVRIELVFFLLCISLNVLSTSLICWRILSHARAFRRNALGERFASPYFTLVSMMVESALPYTVFGIANFIAIGTQSGFSMITLSTWLMLTCISPQILILRLAKGKAWTRDTAAKHTITTLEFAGCDTVDPSHTGTQNCVRMIRLPPVDEEEHKSETLAAL